MQSSVSSLYEFFFFSVLRDLSTPSVDFEDFVMNISRDLSSGSNMANVEEDPISGRTDFFQCDLGEASLGQSHTLDSKLYVFKT